MKKNILLLVLGIYIFAGCGSKKPDEETTHKIVVFFSARSDASSILKSTATENEKKINKVILYGVNAQNVIIENYLPINNPTSTGTTLTISNDVKMLYAIANPTDAMVASSPSILSDILALTTNYIDAPQPPFLMGGKGDVSNYNVNIELIRAVAKISFVGDKGFAIESLTVENSPNQGYVFGQASPAVPSSSSMVNYPKIESSNPTVYLAENTKQNPTRFVVTGKFDNRPATYTFALTDGGLRIDIARNTHYQVTITPKTESECTITITIPDWNDGVNDGIVVPDTAFE